MKEGWRYGPRRELHTRHDETDNPHSRPRCPYGLAVCRNHLSTAQSREVPSGPEFLVNRAVRLTRLRHTEYRSQTAEDGDSAPSARTTMADPSAGHPSGHWPTGSPSKRLVNDWPVARPVAVPQCRRGARYVAEQNRSHREAGIRQALGGGR